MKRLWITTALLLVAITSLSAHDWSDQKQALRGLKEVRVWIVLPDELKDNELHYLKLIREQIAKLGIRENPKLIRPSLGVTVLRTGGIDRNRVKRGCSSL